jgi:dTDP-4-dehydrorhamnose 3,5-epimerase
METEKTGIEGLQIISPDIFKDERGFFMETFNVRAYAEIGIADVFVQDNYARSIQNTIRGLHYQQTPGQAKLMRVSLGAIRDVAVDIRTDSPTCGHCHSIELTAENNKQLYIPHGFAHGYCVLSEIADVQYKCSSLYELATERTIAWNDPDLAITWPVTDPILSPRDRAGIAFADYLKDPDA